MQPRSLFVSSYAWSCRSLELLAALSSPPVITDPQSPALACFSPQAQLHSTAYRLTPLAKKTKVSGACSQSNANGRRRTP